jgi:tetratricopeptide (TPR) repeat protein
LRPGWKEAELNRALALLRLGRLVEAGDAFQRVIDLTPDCREAIIGLTTVALETGAWEKAVALRRRLNSVGEALPDVTYNLGVVLERQGRMEDALRFYCEALKERPRFPEALLNLGHVLDRMGRRKEATECWKRALGLDSKLASSYFGGAK